MQQYTLEQINQDYGNLITKFGTENRIHISESHFQFLMKEVERLREVERNYNEIEMDHKLYKECSDWLLKIRDELSAVSFPEGMAEYSIATPRGIYEQVKHLKDSKLAYEARKSAK